VPVLIEVGGESFARGMRETAAPLEIYAYAMDEHGPVRDFFSRKVGLDIAQAGATFKQTGFKYWGHLDLHPGRYSVRALVRNEVTGLQGLTTTEVVVPAQGGEVALSAPLFPEPPGIWILGREDEAEQRAGVPFPFHQNGEPFLPAAAPRVQAGQSLPFSLVAYNLGEGSLTASCQLFDAAGEAVGGGGDVELSGGAQAGAGLARLGGTFTAGRLARGEYLLLVTVKNLASNQEQSSSIPLRVL
jgi:hypothetical protein